MTREEAIRRLLNIERCTPIHTREDIRDFEALEMAIKALEQEPSGETVSLEAFKQVMWERDIAIEQLKELGYGLGQKIKSSDDAISRQAVIDACEQSINILEAVDRIMDLPSVEQEPKYCDRNICVLNEYNGIGCKECEVTKSQEQKKSCNTMDFPNTFDEFAKDYGFKDSKEVYTNGSDLIPVFRVKQWLEHIEPKTGHWIIVHRKGIYTHLVCDKCLSNAPYDCRTNYCPNCGCRMVEPQESEDKE